MLNDYCHNGEHLKFTIMTAGEAVKLTAKNVKIQSLDTEAMAKKQKI